MNCNRIANQTAEAFDKLLVGKPAIYAGDPGLKTKVRRFGTYVPNLSFLDNYQFYGVRWRFTN